LKYFEETGSKDQRGRREKLPHFVKLLGKVGCVCCSDTGRKDQRARRRSCPISKSTFGEGRICRSDTVLRQVHPMKVNRKVLLTKIFDNCTSSTLDSQDSGNLENDV
jgi:hypothetical protein